MIHYRPAETRGHVRWEWLNTFHSFSFGTWYDPRYMGVSVLRVLNDDRVAPGAGFDWHGHRDMEILSYVLEGQIEHEDSMGHEEVLSVGQWQLMRAGTGIRHREFNPSSEQTLRFLQIWIVPEEKGLIPTYERLPAWKAGTGERPIASPDGAGGTLRVRQDARVSQVRTTVGQSWGRHVSADRVLYLHLVRGRLRVQDQVVVPGDALTVTGDTHLLAVSEAASEWVVFDLPQPA